MSTQQIFEQLRNSSAENGPALSIGTLTADVMDQAAAVDILQQQDIGLLHIDVMDGRVWPKITVGHFFVAGLRTELLKDVHLLIEEPEKQIPAFVGAGADMIAFSLENCSDIGAALDLVAKCQAESDSERTVRRGLSVYPETSLEVIKPYLDKTDYVTLVSISPDSGKQNFLSEMPDRIGQLREWKDDLVICIDGAVKKANIGEVAQMGSDVIVTGSAVFDGNDAAKNINEMTASIQQSLSLS